MPESRLVDATQHQHWANQVRNQGSLANGSESEEMFARRS
jgi:hypothetical protein